MVRVYQLFYYYSHLVFYDVLCIATVQILFILETQTNTHINIMLCVVDHHLLLNPKDAIGATNSKLITKLGSAIDAMHFTAGGVTKWINVKTAVKLFVTLAQH